MKWRCILQTEKYFADLYSKTPRVSQKYEQLSALRRWFSCCWSAVDCCSSCGVLCLFHVLFVHWFLSLLVLQSSWWGRESWLLYFVWHPGVLWLLFLWLFLTVPCEGLLCVIVVYPDHTVTFTRHLATYIYVWKYKAGTRTCHIKWRHLSN